MTRYRRLAPPPTKTPSRPEPGMTPPSNGQLAGTNDHLVQSDNPDHPANLIPSLCAKFWTLGWVTGTGGGASIREEYAPSPSPPPPPPSPANHTR